MKIVSLRKIPHEEGEEDLRLKSNLHLADIAVIVFTFEAFLY
jgi:hypothetical protein